MSGAAESAERCLVWVDQGSTECGQPATGRVYDESDQCEVAACAGHVSATARGRVNDYRSILPTPPTSTGGAS